VLLGDNIAAMQDLLRTTYQVCGCRACTTGASMLCCFKQPSLGAQDFRSLDSAYTFPLTPQAELAKAQGSARRAAERSMDAQRASATVPRDTVQLYQQLAASGLQYGPAFRLLRNVHVPDTTGSSAAQ
jgi:hypothetical protein